MFRLNGEELSIELTATYIIGKFLHNSGLRGDGIGCHHLHSSQNSTQSGCFRPHDHFFHYRFSSAKTPRGHS